VRQRLAAQGVRPFSLPLAVDVDRWLQRAATPWDAFPDTRSGKLDAETAALAKALESPTVSLVTGAHVERLTVAPDGRRIEAVEYVHRGVRRRTPARTASPTAPASSAGTS
jgi:choline dehydrogenase-like flavoprotein